HVLSERDFFAPSKMGAWDGSRRIWGFGILRCDVAEEQRRDLTVKRFRDVPTFRVTSRQVSDSTPVNGPSCSLIARSEKAETPRGNAIMNSLRIREIRLTSRLYGAVFFSRKEPFII